MSERGGDGEWGAFGVRLEVFLHIFIVSTQRFSGAWILEDATKRGVDSGGWQCGSG